MFNLIMLIVYLHSKSSLSVEIVKIWKYHTELVKNLMMISLFCLYVVLCEHAHYVALSTRLGGNSLMKILFEVFP